MKQHTPSIHNFTTSVFCFLFIISYPNSSFAQSRIEIPMSPSLSTVGSGARALGMGGAFIAIADDATAASWNPAGLIQLDFPEISFVADAFHRITDNTLWTEPQDSGPQTVSNLDINYLSFVYPFNYWGRNMTLSLNYQHTTLATGVSPTYQSQEIYR